MPRIYELAKQLNVANKDILAKCPELGIVVKSHSSSLSPEQARAVIQLFRPEILEQVREGLSAPPPVEKEKPVAPPPAPAPVVKAPERPRPAAPSSAPSSPRPHHHRPPHGRRPHRDRRHPVDATPVTTTPAPPPPPKEPEKPVIVVTEGITVRELSTKTKTEPGVIIKSLMGLGVMATINQRITPDVAELVGTELGFIVKKEALFKAAELAPTSAEQDLPRASRAPVVTVMGHVDHGKTLLLDCVRKTNVVAGEAGGITQHMGAYSVETPGGRITFIDTPGHEAFTAMRARGVSVTDIVILVVAADDGIMPQTEEAIHHAQAAGSPIIVAINKCDLPAANVQRVKQQLAERNLLTEDWGGKVIAVEVSAKKGTNIEKLLEMILLQAEMMELKAPAEGRARGVVVEANLDKNRGPVATVLNQSGVLKIGASFVCGLASGRVRALFSAEGNRLDSAPPSMPVMVLGFNEMPNVGDVLMETKDEKEARFIAQERSNSRKAGNQTQAVKMTLESLQEKLSGLERKELAVVVKADVAGSVEALRDTLERIEDPRVRLKVIHGAVGAISETDVNLAAASNAILVAFNVRPSPNAETLAQRLGVEIRFYSIIYNVVDEIKKALEGLLDPEKKEKAMGRAEVREVFKIKKAGSIAGCYVQQGQIKRGAHVRVVRDGAVVHTGKLGSLRRFKEDVKEVGVNFECGITVENFQDVKAGDILEFFEVSEVTRSLES